MTTQEEAFWNMVLAVVEGRAQPLSHLMEVNDWGYRLLEYRIALREEQVGLSGEAARASVALAIERRHMRIPAPPAESIPVPVSPPPPPPAVPVPTPRDDTSLRYEMMEID